MNDRYAKLDECCQRLKQEHLKYKTLYIAFDLDNTVFDFHKVGDRYPKVEELLLRSKVAGFKLILFSANEGESLQRAIEYCTQQGYTPDYINESPVMNTTKPYYNLLLDDRAGLGKAITILEYVLNNQNTDQL